MTLDPTILTHRFYAAPHCPNFRLIIQVKERRNFTFLIGAHRMEGTVYILQDRGCPRIEGERGFLMESHNFLMWLLRYHMMWFHYYVMWFYGYVMWFHQYGMLFHH